MGLGRLSTSPRHWHLTALPICNAGLAKSSTYNFYAPQKNADSPYELEKVLFMRRIVTSVPAQKNLRHRLQPPAIHSATGFSHNRDRNCMCGFCPYVTYWAKRILFGLEPMHVTAKLTIFTFALLRGHSFRYSGFPGARAFPKWTAMLSQVFPHPSNGTSSGPPLATGFLQVRLGLSVRIRH
jgi:hypothetical protein